jgi:transglutaminase-like putative cysteine protease
MSVEITKLETEEKEKVYEITERVRVTDFPEGTTKLDLWMPHLVDDAYQRVLDVRVEAPLPAVVTYDPDYGNAILHLEAFEPERAIGISVAYRVLKRLPDLDLDPEKVGKRAGRREPFHLTLGPERHVRVDGEMRKLAREAVGRETNPLLQAKLIYDFVREKMRYNAEEQSWVGSTEHALACSVGNCNDIHALFLSLCRSLGIPSRLVMGFALEAPTPETCEVCGYHCWVEFHVPNLGWIPADDSCACKYGKEHLFGTLELNHIAFSRGRDILLNPPQRGDRLLFFASAYVEVNGMKHPVERHLTFREL